MMEQNTNQEKQTLTPKKEMSDFRKALLWTTVCTVLISGIALIGGIIAAIVFHSQGRNEISKGIWTGLAIGISILIVAMGITCFVLIASIG
jgi:ABC-type sugar transport system permease subunit